MEAYENNFVCTTFHVDKSPFLARMKWIGLEVISARWKELVES